MPHSVLPGQIILSSRIANIQGLFAADLARLLVQQGLSEAPIQKFTWGYTYFTPRLRYSTSSSARFAGRPVWRPSFLAPEVWDMAAAQFRVSDPLLLCITHKLFPQLQDIDALYHYVYQERPLSISFLERGILGTPIRVTRDFVFQFDQAAVYQSYPHSGELAETFLPWHICYETDINCSAWVKASRSFHPGMSLEQCLEIFLSMRALPAELPKYSGLDRIVQRVSRPCFERDPENQNASTFDRIRVEVGLTTYRFKSFPQLAAAVRRMKPSIDRYVLEKLGVDAGFRKYGVPVNFLKVTECVLRRDHVLEYLFELKEPHDAAASN